MTIDEFLREFNDLIALHEKTLTNKKYTPKISVTGLLRFEESSDQAGNTDKVDSSKDSPFGGTSEDLSPNNTLSTEDFSKAFDEAGLDVEETTSCLIELNKLALQRLLLSTLDKANRTGKVPTEEEVDALNSLRDMVYA